jgi:cellulose synthase/poly-beta-1,6-N-acetylglucosamine synthase-like glycosyltransferase
LCASSDAQNAEVSIIIPTLSRPEDLRKLLHSILKQTTLPKEVIVVDDSEDRKTNDIVEKMRVDFSMKNVLLKYTRGGGKTKKGIALARNIGLSHSSGEIVLFLDDDVILDKDYLKEILKAFKKYPNALGIQGYLTNSGEQFRGARSLMTNSINKVFFLYHREKNGCRVLPSGYLTYPSSLSKDITCSWLEGKNSSYKKEVLKNFQWDKNLREYSLFEDADLSYRIARHYPNCLYIIPHAKILHRASPLARRPTELLIYIETTYHTYFFLKNIQQSLMNRITFLWSRLGNFVNMCFFACVKKRPRLILTLISAYVYTLKHLEEIKEGKFAYLCPDTST